MSWTSAATYELSWLHDLTLALLNWTERSETNGPTVTAPSPIMWSHFVRRFSFIALNSFSPPPSFSSTAQDPQGKLEARNLVLNIFGVALLTLRLSSGISATVRVPAYQ